MGHTVSAPLGSHGPEHGPPATDFEAILDAAADLTLVIESDGVVRYVSRSASRLLGWEPEDWVGRSSLELVHPDDLARTTELLLENLETGPGVKLGSLLRIRTAEGGWRVFECVANNQLHDTRIAGFVVSSRDLTERLEAEERERVARSRFEQAFDHSPISMALLSNDGTILRVNEKMTHLAGRSHVELTGESVFTLIRPEDRQLARRYATRLMAGDDQPPLELRAEVGDLSTQWVRVTVNVVRDGHGAPDYTVAHLEDITEQRRLTEELAIAATTDALTGLLNRAGFTAAVEAAMTDDGRTTDGALLLVDLDGFKTVNDTHGHHAGDTLLVEVAERLRSCLRDGDLVGRLGGDEFALYGTEVVDADDAIRLAERVRAALAAPVDLSDGRTGSITGSVGVALLGGPVALSAALQAADAASYGAKRSGGDHIELTWCHSG